MPKFKQSWFCLTAGKCIGAKRFGPEGWAYNGLEWIPRNSGIAKVEKECHNHRATPTICPLQYIYICKEGCLEIAKVCSRFYSWTPTLWQLRLCLLSESYTNRVPQKQWVWHDALSSLNYLEGPEFSGQENTMQKACTSCLQWSHQLPSLFSTTPAEEPASAAELAAPVVQARVGQVGNCWTQHKQHSTQCKFLGRANGQLRAETTKDLHQLKWTQMGPSRLKRVSGNQCPWQDVEFCTTRWLPKKMQYIVKEHMQHVANDWWVCWCWIGQPRATPRSAVQISLAIHEACLKLETQRTRCPHSSWWTSSKRVPYNLYANDSIIVPTYIQ